MLIAGKSLGSRRKLFEDFSIPLPPDWRDDSGGGGGGVTLRDVIERVVRDEVRAFQKRQTDRQLVKALTSKEIETAAEKGKIEMGASEVGIQKVDPEQAVETALVAFEDGLYLVVIDGNQFTDLDSAVFLNDNSQLTFVRLTLLTGA